MKKENFSSKVNITRSREVFSTSNIRKKSIPIDLATVVVASVVSTLTLVNQKPASITKIYCTE